MRTDPVFDRDKWSRVAIKPPLGIKPRWMHDESRMADLVQACARYMDAGEEIEEEWFEELCFLLGRYEERKLIATGSQQGTTGKTGSTTNNLY